MLEEEMFENRIAGNCEGPTNLSTIMPEEPAGTGVVGVDRGVDVGRDVGAVGEGVCTITGLPSPLSSIQTGCPVTDPNESPPCEAGISPKV
jgi:hypothetical protein